MSSRPAARTSGAKRDHPPRHVQIEVIPSRPTCYRITLENIYGESLVIVKRYSEIRSFYDAVKAQVTLDSPSSHVFPPKTCCARYNDLTLRQRKDFFQTFFSDLIDHNANLGITLVRRFTGMREL